MEPTLPEVPGSERRSRRAILLGVLSGLGVLGANALGASGVRAGAPPVYRGQGNPTTAPTSITRTDKDNNVTFGGADYAVAANSHVVQGTGVIGHASGNSGTAVEGNTSGHWSQVALRGNASNGLGEGIAVKADTINGIGVLTSATGGAALEVHGRATFDRSGKVTFSSGQRSRTVTRTGAANVITPATIIVATIQGEVAGTWVTGCVRTGPQSFAIHLNKAAPKQLKVGFFLIN